MFSLNTDKKHILFLFRVKFENNEIVTLNDMQKLNSSSLLHLIQYIKDSLTIANDNYRVIPIQSLIFSYGIREGEINPTIGVIKKNIKYQNYYKNKLPIAMIPEDYGLVLNKINNNYTISIDTSRGQGLSVRARAIIIINVKREGDKTINHVKYFKDNNLLFTWTDTIECFTKKKFIRRIGKSILYYEDGDLTLYTIIKKTRAMLPKKIGKNNNLNHKFITMDLETVSINNILVPYLLCWYNGKKAYSYFLLPPNEFQDLSKLTSEGCFALDVEKYI